MFQYGSTAEIFDNNTVFYEMDLIFVDHPSRNFSFTIENPLNIKIETPANCKIVKKVLETHITCDMEAAERTDIGVTYSSDENVKKRDSYFLFADSFKITENTKTLNVLVKIKAMNILCHRTEKIPIIDKMKKITIAANRFNVI